MLRVILSVCRRVSIVCRFGSMTAGNETGVEQHLLAGDALMAGVTLDKVYKIYDNGYEAVKNFNLDIVDGEFLVLVGPSGCGKSTTLRMIAGLENNSKGRIVIGENLVNDVPPKDRDIAMVFQNYALYPHMTVYKNMAFGLKLRKFPKEEIDRRVRYASKILGLDTLLNRKPSQLSGGQRQRVAMGRAIVREPKVFLFDEPLSNLDAKMRVEMRKEILLLHERIDTTMIYVTHDQIEAMTLGDRICVMNVGVIEQVGEPRIIFDYPATLFVARFIGTPPMNLFNGVLVKRGGIYSFKGGEIIFELPEHMQKLLAGKENGLEVVFGVRPRAFTLKEAVEEDIGSAVVISGRPGISEMLGEEILLHLTNDEHDFIASVEPRHEDILRQEKVEFVIDMELSHLFDRKTSRNLTIPPEVVNNTTLWTRRIAERSERRRRNSQLENA